MSKKKKQHFVSQFYLRYWSKCGEKVFTNINDKPVYMAIKEVACSNYFYKLDSINEETRKILLQDIDTLKSPHLKETFRLAVTMTHIIDVLGKNTNDIDLKMDEEKIKTNVVEDIYTMIEDVAAPDFDKLLNDIDNFDINSYQNVLRYIVFQLVRTKKSRINVGEKINDLLYEKNIDIDTYWIVASLIRAEEMTFSLIEQLYKIVLVSNETEVNFITGDNPSINLCGLDENKIKLYFPISSRKALFIEKLNISESDAKKLKTSVLDMF